jgi:predicted nucleotide-binding protein (sugar kinase/HSP70/actin superfamily)
VQERVLRDLGRGCRLHGLSQYSGYQAVTRLLPEIFGISPARALQALYRLFARSSVIHELDNMVRRLRPEDFAGAESLLRSGLDKVAGTRSLRDIRRVRQELRASFPRTLRPPKARIGIVGEVYLMLEPFANSEIEKELGRLGAEVVTERSLYRHLRHVLLNSDLNYFQTARFAGRYIGESPGGEVIKTVGEAIRFARDGLDGVLHIFPFTCMPENMALEVLQKVGEDYRVPVMSLSFDEHTSKTGLITRLEAFVDMVTRRRQGTGVRRRVEGKAACL